jgi:hypothetical protein
MARSLRRRTSRHNAVPSATPSRSTDVAAVWESTVEVTRALSVTSAPPATAASAASSTVDATGGAVRPQQQCVPEAERDADDAATPQYSH